ncbi:helix-turn-helix domain-containing protein [Actinoplanes sp. NPDC049802]|uniref:helix-turn-helix domain-containing protein n=1 Tax=Actinoplanes sp. NPDC049802 TaxID=3154742 RepID=UPI0033ED8F87
MCWRSRRGPESPSAPSVRSYESFHKRSGLSRWTRKRIPAAPGTEQTFQPVSRLIAVTRGYRYRFHPTPNQADLLTRTFGCVRVAAGLAVTACRADVRPQRGTTSRAGDRR